MLEKTLHQLFAQKKLGYKFQTTDGRSIEIIEFGDLNKTSGPDFLYSKLLLDDQIWIGHIEFHIKSSDWNVHGHQNDLKYRNVIAHFVLNHDMEIHSGEMNLPTVELDVQIASNYFNSVQDVPKNTITCENQIQDVTKQIVNEQINHALLNRLNRKADEIHQQLRSSGGDHYSLLIGMLAKSIGGMHNKHAFESLAQKIDFSVLAYLNYNPIKVEALLLGCAGFLGESFEEDYPSSLKNEFDYLSKLLNLTPLSKSEWNFGAVRPTSHPEFRVAQFAAVLNNFRNFTFSEILNGKYSFQSFLDIELNEFWMNHYHLQKQSKKRSTSFSNQMKSNLIINTFVPLKYAYASLKGDAHQRNSCLNILAEVKPEKNNIIRFWSTLDIKPKNAAQSQALIEQKNEYCLKKKCLFCTIGTQLLE